METSNENKKMCTNESSKSLSECMSNLKFNTHQNSTDVITMTGPPGTWTDTLVENTIDFIECPLCLEDEVPTTEVIRCSRCNLEICQDCFDRNLKEKQGVCPGPKCEYNMAMDEHARRLNHPLLDETVTRLKIQESEKDKKRQREAEAKATEERIRRTNDTMLAVAQMAELCRERIAKATACPRCKLAFFDYDGCNAVRCSKCGAGFCGVCLQDCGDDAHEHAFSHGPITDKRLFREAKKQRNDKAIRTFFKERVDTTKPELIQMVKQRLASADPRLANSDELDHAIREATLKIRARVQSALNEERILVGLKSDEGVMMAKVPDGFRVHFGVDGRFHFEEYTGEILPGDTRTEDGWSALGKNDFQSATCTGSAERRGSLSRLSEMFQERRCSVFLTRQWGCKFAFQYISPCLQVIDPKVGTDSTIHFSLEDVAGEITHMRGICRLWRLFKYVKNPRFKISDCILRYFGIGPPKPLIGSISELQDCCDESNNDKLNKEQLCITKILTMTNARLCQGPPGTGKTRVISSIVKRVVHDTKLNVVVLSERNCAIDALAVKFYHDCMTKEGHVRDFDFWRNIVCEGSKAAGAHTMKFYPDEKVPVDPRVCELQEALDQACSELSRITKDVRRDLRMLSDLVKATRRYYAFDGFSEGDLVEFSESNSFWRSGTVKEVVVCKKAQAVGKKRNVQNIQEDTVIKIKPRDERKTAEILLSLHRVRKAGAFNSEYFDSAGLGAKMSPLWSYLVEPLIVTMDNVRSKDVSVNDWNNAFATFFDTYGVAAHQRDLLLRLNSTETSDLLFAFSDLPKSGTLHKLSYREVKALECRVALYRKDLIAMKTEVRREYAMKARIRMSTIASAHRLFRHDDTESEEFDTRTLVIFDEASTIPMYEIIAAQRFCPNLHGIHVFGDQNQLPPFKRNRSSGLVESLMGCCKHPCPEFKLITQYRVPRLIASALNEHIYKGSYKSDPSVVRGEVRIHFLPREHKQRSRNGSRRGNHRDEEWNAAQIELAIQLAARSLKGGKCVIIMSPYREMNRRIENKLKKIPIISSVDAPKKTSRLLVSTIQGTQGQQADDIILCMVKTYPTPGFTKECLNVALSRTQCSLHVLISGEKEFRNFVEKGWLGSHRRTRWKDRRGNVEEEMRINESFRVVRGIFRRLLKIQDSAKA